MKPRVLKLCLFLRTPPVEARRWLTFSCLTLTVFITMEVFKMLRLCWVSLRFRIQ
jgi:hypothetical protein